jgi:hypothetical protein
MRSALLRLHRDENAQVSFLAVAAALCFVALLAMVMNSNDLVRQRVRMQEVADVTALSAATWNARGMNLASMINVLNSKLLTMTILVNSLNKTLPIVNKVAVAQKAAFKACSPVPLVGAFCAAMVIVVELQHKAIVAIEKVIKTIAKFTACKKLVWTVMESLQTAAEGIRSSFPAIAVANAVEVATRNGASFGVAVNGGAFTGGAPATQALYLPITSDGYKTSDFCTAMKAGGPGYVLEGYDDGQGPMRLGKKIWDLVFIPFFNLLPHPIFYGFYSYYMAQIGCTPDAESDEQKPAETTFYDLPACRKFNAEATWERFRARTDWVAQGNWTTDDFVAWESLEEGKGDGIPDDDMDKFEDLGKYGEGSPVGGSLPEPSRGPGYRALVSESNTATSKPDCREGDPDSGYPASNGGLFGLGCLVDPSNCILLRDNPEYTHYSGSTHQRNPSGLDAERTGTYYMKLEREDRRQDDGNGNRVTRYRYTIDVWVLADSGTKELSEEELDEYVQDQGGDSTKPGDGNDGANSKNCKNVVQPLLLDAQNNPYNRLRHIALVHLELDGENQALPFWSTFFDSPPRRIAAYAQAQVYNKLSEDMFTQDWRVRLEQANLLEAALGSDQGISLEGSGNVAQEFIRSVNNH